MEDNANLKDILDPTTEDIDHGKLEAFLLDFVDKMEGRAIAVGKMSKFDGDVRRLLEVCCKLWREKETWREEYLAMADRYSKHLDKEIAAYNKLLGKRTKRKELDI